MSRVTETASYRDSRRKVLGLVASLTFLALLFVQNLATSKVIDDQASQPTSSQEPKLYPLVTLEWLDVGITRYDGYLDILVENVSAEPVLVELNVRVEADGHVVQYLLPSEVLAQGGWSTQSIDLRDILQADGLDLQALQYAGSARLMADVVNADTGAWRLGAASEIVSFHPDDTGVAIYDAKTKIELFQSGDFKRALPAIAEVSEAVEDSVGIAHWLRIDGEILGMPHLPADSGLQAGEGQP